MANSLMDGPVDFIALKRETVLCNANTARCYNLAQIRFVP